jgi:hypothetical protein
MDELKGVPFKGVALSREGRVLRVANADSSLWARNDKELGPEGAGGWVMRGLAGFFASLRMTDMSRGYC